MREGPSVHRRDPELVCTGCKHLKERLVKSGRQPEWDSFCQHPGAPDVGVAPSMGSRPYALIEDYPLCPTWCPLRDWSKAKNFVQCSVCGSVSEDKGLGIRHPTLNNTLTGLRDIESVEWKCPKCGAWNK